MTDLDAITELIQKNKSDVTGVRWNDEVMGPVIILGVVAAGLTAFILYARSRNKAFADCVEANGGIEDLCIDR